MSLGASASQSDLPFVISRALILWDARIGAGYTRAPEVLRIRHRFTDDLYARFEYEIGRPSRTNVERAFDWYLRSNPTLVDWYQTLLGQEGEAVEWDADRKHPVIKFCGVTAWERLCSHFDPDALLALDLARARKASKKPAIAEEYSNWTTIARVENDYLDHPERMNEPVSDLHIHVSGIRLPQAAWREMLLDDIHLKIFKNLNRIYEGHGRNLAHDIGTARSAYRMLEDFVGNNAMTKPTLRPAKPQWWRWSHRVLMEERQLLTNAWCALLADDPRDDILRQLDIYLSTKHRFFQTVRQAAFPAEPGLRHFELNYFSALKRAVPRERWRKPAHASGTSPRLVMNPFGDACQFLMESKRLQRIELRISPLENANEYLRFFKSWCALKEQIDNDLRLQERATPEIRFTVHFRRSLKRRQQSAANIDGVPDEAVKLRALDRSTAALRVALNSAGEYHQDWMRALARIDVAGQERDSQASLFALHLRLLRGDCAAIRFLEQLGPEDPRFQWFQRWVGLRERNQHHPVFDTSKDRRLGLTVHAGEDFENLLDGLYQVGIVLDAFALGQGDSIGHGLALATLPDDPWLTPENLAIMPVGQMLDGLCWLKHLSLKMVSGSVDPDDPTTFGKEAAELDSLIFETSALVYQDMPLDANSATVSDHVQVWRNSVVPAAIVKRNGRTDKMFAHRWSETGMAARGRTLPLEISLSGVKHLLMQAQQMLLHRLIKRKVVIELNPSSNVRITGVDTLRQAPTIGLFRMVGEELLACINTDNPSVFTTRIENEYSLVYRGALDLGMKKDDIEKNLDTVRRIGMNKNIMR
jgi:hypothetical protein